MKPYSELLSSATLRPIPFEIKVDDEKLNELKLLIKHSKIPPKTYENTQTDGRYGVSNKWISDAKDYWETRFDWRKHETHINSFPNFLAPIVDPSSGQTIQVHFVALFSQRLDAVPIILMHGWPGSFLEFLPILALLREKYTPETLPYYVVAPSSPGYAWSELPEGVDVTLEDLARIMHTLAIGLGFESGYITQGGDTGSRIARIMGAWYPSCKAVHLNYCIRSPPKDFDLSTLSAEDKEGMGRGVAFKTLGSAYAVAHATRPSTMGIVLSNPLALLTWIGEKFLSWTDEDPSLDTILESVTLYWFTETIARSLYSYRQSWIPGGVSTHEDPRYYLHKPMGYSLFPQEFSPVLREWAALTGQLVWFRRHEKGGHFAAMEQPELLLSDIEEFVKQVW